MKTLRRLPIQLVAIFLVFCCHSQVVAALPATVDSDVNGYFSSPQSRTDFIFAGRLQLKQKANDPATYSGHLYDYQSQQSLPATVDASNATAPVLHLQTGNGNFAITCNASFGMAFFQGTASHVPPRYQSVGPISFSAITHHTSTATYQVIISQRVGPFTPEFEITGQLLINYDANNRISGGTTLYMDSQGHAHHGTLVGSGYFSSSYLYLRAKFGPRIFGIAATFSGTTFSGNAFTGGGKLGSSWVISGSP